MRLDAGFRIAPNWLLSRKMLMTSELVDMTSSSNFWRCCVSLVKFSYWSNFLSISCFQVLFIRDWSEIRKSEIPPFLILPNILRLGWVRDTKFGTNVSNEKSLNAAKCQGYNFYHFWVIKEKPTGGGIQYFEGTHVQLSLRYE